MFEVSQCVRLRGVFGMMIQVHTFDFSDVLGGVTQTKRPAKITLGTTQYSTVSFSSFISGARQREGEQSLLAAMCKLPLTEQVLKQFFLSSSVNEKKLYLIMDRVNC